MTLEWYVARLRNMSPAEIAHRVHEKFKKVRSRVRFEGWDKFVSASDGGIVVPFLPGFGEVAQRCNPEVVARIKDYSDSFLKGQYSALGHRWPTIDFADPSGLFWHKDPVTGSLWPNDQYCFDIAYRHNRDLGDVKLVWELSRLQFLQPIALLYAITKEPQYLSFIQTVLQSWYRSNPPFRGVAWSSGIELALRAVSILVVATFCGTQLDRTTRACIAQIFRAHAFWLEQYPSRFSSANNHKVAEDAALYLLGSSCGFLAPDHRRLMLKRSEMSLTREAQLQLLPDGTPAEQSPTYGALTAELLLLCSLVGAARGARLPAVIDQRLSAFANQVSWLADAAGFVPAIGDDDEGRVLTFGNHETCYPASVAAAIKGFIGSTETTPPFEVGFRNLLVPEPRVSAAGPSGACSFVDGGYTVHRSRVLGQRTVLVFDHAPLGYLSIAAHGHADALSLVLAVDDHPLIIDPGTYLYHSGHSWRDWFRGTRAHNTVTVGGEDQSRISGPFNWALHAVSRQESFKDSPFEVTASHNGYCRKFAVTHTRQVRETSTGYLVSDCLLGEGSPRPSEIVFTIAEDCDVTVSSHIAKINRAGRHVASIVLPQNGTLNMSRGGDNLSGGWYSPAFGKKLPVSRLSWMGPIGQDPVITELVLVAST